MIFVYWLQFLRIQMKLAISSLFETTKCLVVGEVFHVPYMASNQVGSPNVSYQLTGRRKQPDFLSAKNIL